MKLLVVARRLAPDDDTGRAVAFRRLVERLRLQHEVRWVVGWERDRLQLPQDCLGVDLRGQGRIGTHVSMWRAGRSAARRFRPDVVLAAGLDVPALGVPTLAVVRDLQGTGWGVNAYEPDLWRRWRSRRLRAIVVPSHGAADALVRLGIPRGRVHLIPDLVDVRGGTENAVSGPREVGLLVQAGRLHPAKGQHFSIDAVSRLEPSEKERVQLHVVGRVADSGYATQLRIAAANQPVTIHEDVQTLEPWLRRAQALTYPTGLDQEWPDVPLQAMAVGTPVIWSDQPTVREALGGLGIPVPPGDLGALRQAIRQCLARPEEMRDMGAASREFVRANYSWNRLQGLWNKRLEAVAGGR